MDIREVRYKQREANLVDGVALNTAVVPNQYGYQSLCYSAMDAIRLSNNYRPKIFAAPDLNVYGLNSVGSTPIGLTPFSDYVTQIRVLPGTIVLGMSIAVLDFIQPGTAGGEAGDFNIANNFYVSLTDEGTGVPFFSDWLSQLLFNVPTLLNDTNNTSRPVYVPKTQWLPLTRPRVILAPGILTATFCYKGAVVNLAPQIVLNCAEPCNVIRNNQECQ
jgi:hypothetical protein